MKKQQYRILLGISSVLIIVGGFLVFRGLFVENESKFLRVGKFASQAIGLVILLYVRYKQNKEEK